LLDRNADVKKKNRLGQMPVLFCFSRLEEDFYRYENKKICMMMIDLLLSKGADINLRIDKKSGYTILMKLAANEILEKEKAGNTLEIIRFLIERGANIYLKGNDNKSVFEIIQNTKYCDLLMKILNNTNQTVFFNTINNESEPSESAKFNSDDCKSNFFNSLGINKKYYLYGEKDVSLEANTCKLNCCLIF